MTTIPALQRKVKQSQKPVTFMEWGTEERGECEVPGKALTLGIIKHLPYTELHLYLTKGPQTCNSTYHRHWLMNWNALSYHPIHPINVSSSILKQFRLFALTYLEDYTTILFLTFKNLLISDPNSSAATLKLSDPSLVLYFCLKQLFSFPDILFTNLLVNSNHIFCHLC